MASTATAANAMTLFLLFASLQTTTCAGIQRRRPFSRIFAFGDSFTDTGNTRTTAGPFAFGHVSNPPYGVTFFHHPTNRYSDGRLVVDFLAQSLSLPFLPPYLHKTANFSNGVNFAVAGSTALDHRFFVDNNVTLDITPQSLHTELQWFEEHLAEKEGCRKVGSPACREVMDDALFWVGEIGVNDYAYSTGSSLSPSTIRNLTINNLTKFLKRLLRRGAKYVVVQGQPLAGCLPLTMSLFPAVGSDDLGCSAVANDYSRTHNNLLQASIRRLQRQFPRSIISYADFAGAHLKVLRKPAAHGFTEPFKVCCGSGGGPYNFDLLNTCGSTDVSRSCAKPAKYVNWDGVHFTEAMYNAVANMFFNRDLCNPPFHLLLSSKSRSG